MQQSLLWSAMTAMSGAARNGAVLSLARVRVGVGEATASPSAYSLLSDWFPARRRATALAIYSADLFVGSGVSLSIGGLIVRNWNLAFPEGGPLGLTGWRAAFLAVGLPGVLLAIWVSTLREPERVRPAEGPSPLRIFAQNLFAILPPFTLIDAARWGRIAFMANALLGLAIAFVVLVLTMAGEPLGQWAAVGCGVYAVASWASSLRHRDRKTFGFVVANPALLAVTVSYGLNAFLAYSVSFWTAPYVIRVLHASTATAGLLVGGTGAAAGFLGVTLGGLVSDRLLQRDQRGRIYVILFGAITPAPFALLAFSSTSILGLCAATFLSGGCAATALGASGAMVQDLVPPHMRGTAIAVFTIGTTLLGLALGPYLAGRLSTITGDLGFAVKCLTLSSPLAFGTGLAVYALLPAALARARLAKS